jgi:type IV secretion system protein VirB1
MKRLPLFSFGTFMLLVASSASSQVAGVDAKFSSLIARCAPTVHPETMAAVISAESRGNQFAIADAGPVALPWSQRKHLVRSHYPDSLDVAVATATELVRKGHTVSLGLSQVNDRNLSRYGISIRDVFDPCVNVSVGGRILTDFYTRAVTKFGQNAAALQAALSGYNSGDWVRGARDGYVGLVYKQVGKPLSIKTSGVVPALRATSSLTGGVVRTLTVPVTGKREFAMSSRAFVLNE